MSYEKNKDSFENYRPIGFTLKPLKCKFYKKSVRYICFNVTELLWLFYPKDDMNFASKVFWPHFEEQFHHFLLQNSQNCLILGFLILCLMMDVSKSFDHDFWHTVTSCNYKERTFEFTRCLSKKFWKMGRFSLESPQETEVASIF